EGNLGKARQCAERARALSPTLGWWDDNPDKLVADIQRQEADKAGTKPSSGSEVQTAKNNATAGGVKDPADGRQFLRQARELFNQGKLDEAEKMTQQAVMTKTHWGWLEDTPDKLRIDLQKARTKHNQEESVRVLAEARKLFNEGKLKEARTKAFIAKRLH